MGTRVVVYGAGGLGREIMQIVRLLWRDGGDDIGYADDGVPTGTNVFGGTVLGGEEYLASAEGKTAIVFGMADSEAKARLYRRFADRPNISFPNVIHPSAFVSEYASLGRGVVVAMGCIVRVGATLGNGVFLNDGAMLGHDAAIGDFSSVMPLAAISGGVRVGERCLIGVHSAIRQGVSIGDGATVGMGSVVLLDVPDGATVLGNPAKRIS